MCRPPPRGGAGCARARRRPPGRGGDPLGRARVPGPGRARRGSADERREGPTDRGTVAEPGTGFETRAIHAGQEPDPLTGAVVTADPPRLDLRARGGRRAQGLRVRAHAQPDPRVARDRPRVARRRRATASRSPAGWRRATPCCACSCQATTSSSRTMPTVAPTGSSPVFTARSGDQLQRRRAARHRCGGKGVA